MTDPTDRLHQAVTSGDLASVERLAREMPEALQMADANGMTPLLLAAAHGHSELAIALVHLGASPDAVNGHRQSALHYAAYHGDAALSQALLRAGADPHAGDLSGTTVMHYAGIGGSLEVIDALASADVDPSVSNIYRERPAHRAAQAGSLEALLHLQQLGADMNVVDALGLTLAHKAAIGNATAVLSWLHKQGLPLDHPDLAGDTPLHGAASLGRETGVQSLLELGQSAAVVNHDRATPLHKAAEAGAEPCVNLLLEHGGDPAARDVLGRTPLHWAALRGHASLVDKLRSESARCKDEWFGFTPGQLAAHYGRTETACALDAETSMAPDLQSPDLALGDAVVWYLGNSGWAIRTAKRLLVFDYVPAGSLGDESGLANGAIRPETVDGLSVTVFVSHAHNDHFSPKILEWREQIPDLRIVTGGTWCEEKGVTVVEGRAHCSLDGLEIRTIPSTDSGVAFLVEADGLRLYHAGDHVSRDLPLEPEFAEEIDWLASVSDGLDLAFLPVFGCGFPSRDGVLEGARYSMERLRPSAVFPMHVAWTSFFYREFAERAIGWGLKSTVIAPDIPGDRFLLREGRIRRLLA